MLPEDENKKQKQFDTFRGRSDAHRKSEVLNQTLPTMLDYSNIRSNSPGGLNTNMHIRCPTHAPEDVYKCQVCSRLRLVCPYRGSLSKGKKSKAEGGSKRIQGTKVQPFSIHILQNTVPIKTQINQSKAEENQKKKTHIQRAQTPQFQSFNELGVKFVDSLPYIKNFEGTERSNNTHIKIEENHPKPINLRPRPASSNTYINQQQRTVPVHHVWQPSPAQSRYVHQQKLPVFVPQTRTRIIEEVVFVPVIRNVLVPSYVINPEQSLHQTPRSKQLHVIPDSNNKTSEFQQSPIHSNSRIKHQYNQKEVMTPENFKKLANSIIR